MITDGEYNNSVRRRRYAVRGNRLLAIRFCRPVRILEDVYAIRLSLFLYSFQPLIGKLLGHGKSRKLLELYCGDDSLKRKFLILDVSNKLYS
jgi:hypothetical protein